MTGRNPPTEADYQRWISRRKSKCGYIVRCKKHLWYVHAPTSEEAEREARHYFVRYFLDGEYDQP